MRLSSDKKSGDDQIAGLALKIIGWDLTLGETRPRSPGSAATLIARLAEATDRAEDRAAPSR